MYTTVKIILMLLLAQITFAGPIANWANFTGPPDKLEGLLQLKKNQCLADTKYFKIPVHPSLEAVHVNWKGERPVCKDNTKSSEKKISSVIFVSKQSLETITKFYKDNLEEVGFYHYQHHPGHSPGDNPEWANDPIISQKRPSEIFLKKKVDQFIWNRDIISAPYVIISEAKELYSASGYKTTIEVYEPAL